MKEKKISITLTRGYLDLIRDILVSKRKNELYFSVLDSVHDIFLFPPNQSLDSLDLDIYNKKIQLKLTGDELEYLMSPVESFSSNENFWILEENFFYDFKSESSDLGISKNIENFILRLVDHSTFFWSGKKVKIKINFSSPEIYLSFPLEKSYETDDLSQNAQTRNILWLGEKNYRRISQIRLGCIGAGGLMNPFVLQAMYHGFRDFTLIDGDKLEVHNLNRFYGGTKNQLNKFKVEVLFEMIKNFDSNIEVNYHTDFFPNAKCIKYLASTDILVCGVDNDHTRLQTQIFSLAFNKPYLDMGSGIILEDNSALEPRVDERGGQIKFFIPGEACIACMGLNLGAIRDYKFIAMAKESGYIAGTELTPPSIITLNSTIASMGLKMITDYITTSKFFARHIKYDEKNLKIFTIKTEKKVNCKVCG